jgi:hypothetical protein
MRFTIRSILCAAFILFLLLVPSSAGSWIMQSISQDANARGISGGLQNGLQIAGTSNDDVFIVQHMMQEAGLNDPYIRDIVLANRDGQVVGESNIPEDLNKFVDEVRSRDDDFGVVFCNMDFPLIVDGQEDDPNEPPEKPKEIDDDKFFVYIIILIEGKYDFGDAPDRYHTLLAANGARHITVPGFCLGHKIDAEADGQPDIKAAGDDLNETDDEDGVVFASVLNPGMDARIDITASSPGFLNAWADFNGDGDWTDEGEKISSDQRLDKGINHIQFGIPAKALAGNTYARFRFTSIKDLSFEGPAPDGEVEDYLVQIAEL